MQRKDTFGAIQTEENQISCNFRTCSVLYLFQSGDTMHNKKSIRCIIQKNASNYILLLCFCVQIYVEIMTFYRINKNGPDWEYLMASVKCIYVACPCVHSKCASEKI